MVGEVRIGGFPGVPLMNGRWFDELDGAEFERRVAVTVDAAPNVLVTHAPPNGVLDGIELGEDAHLGVEALARQLERGVP